ncbi:MAG: sodium-dependent transporter [Bacteroidales bacterium]|nr:sodium-dependent transporter [Bacteroidales bacterium]
MEKEKFGRFGALLALAGSAVGLGNIWRFPFVTGENGGAAFIIIYIFVMVLMCFPIMLSEFIIGRRSGSNAMGAFDRLMPSTGGKHFGAFICIIPILVLSYYSVIGGWILEYFFKACTFSFDGVIEDGQIEQFFTSFTSSVIPPVFCHTLFMVATLMIVIRGVKSGIEKFSKVMMPALFFIMVIIAVASCMLPGADRGISYLLHPDFSKVTEKTVTSAIGQAFFSLTLGVGTMMTYAAYIKKSDNLQAMAVRTSLADLIFALIAGVAVIPAVFSFNINPEGGPGLVFQTFPALFSKIPMGNLVAILFFFAIIIAAISSSISLLEAASLPLIEEKHYSRKRATLTMFFISWTIGVLCSLSFGPLSSLTIFGNNIFSFIDALCANALMPLAGLICVVFVGWRMKKEDVWSEFTNDGTLKQNVRIFPFLWVCIRYVAPLTILCVALIGWLN